MLGFKRLPRKPKGREQAVAEGRQDDDRNARTVAGAEAAREDAAAIRLLYEELFPRVTNPFFDVLPKKDL